MSVGTSFVLKNRKYTIFLVYDCTVSFEAEVSINNKNKPFGNLENNYDKNVGTNFTGSASK